MPPPDPVTRRKFPRATALGLLLAAAFAGALIAGHPRGRVDVAYGPAPEERMDICRPAGNGPYPGVVMIHGGGWISGDKTAYREKCRRFADAGILAAAIDYRLAPRETGSPADWPSRQIGDVQLAIRWLRRNAAALGLDPARLCAMGDSAGGYLAIYAGAAPGGVASDVAGLLPDQSPAVSCAVDYFGPVDALHPGTAILADLYRRLLGGATPDSDPALYRAVSPLYMIGRSMPPVMIAQGTRDDIVAPSQSQALLEMLKSMGVETEFIQYNGGHGFTGMSPKEYNDMTEATMAFVKAHAGAVKQR